MSHANTHESLARTWIWIAVMLGIILFKGLLAFTVVSDMGQPTWAYRPVRDVPAASPYAAYPLLPHPQHVRGDKGE
jgi:hypothetical protein